MLYMESKGKRQMNLFTKQKQTHRLRKWIYGYQRGQGRDKRRVRDSQIQTTVNKSSRVLLYSTGNYIQCPVLSHNGKEYETLSKKVLVVQLCPTLCDPVDCIAHQASLSMGFSRQEYGVGYHFLLQGLFLTRD